MQITVETTEQDHISFYHAYGFKRNLVLKLLILLIVDLILSGSKTHFSVFLVDIVSFGIVLFLFIFLIPYFVARRKFENARRKLLYPDAPKIYKPFALGIEIVEQNEMSFIKYEEIKQVDNAGGYLFIKLFNNGYYLLPKYCFSSLSEYQHFVYVLKNGVNNAKGIKKGNKISFKPIHIVGLLCMIPLVGAIAGIVLIILGLSSYYKDKVFIVMGSLGILITIAVYGSLFYWSQNSDFVGQSIADMTQTQINDLVQKIEFYKLQNGTYPDSLQQVDTNNKSFVLTNDPIQSWKGRKSVSYQYYKQTNRYVLFSLGVDGEPNTSDDIYPTLTNPDTSKLGFVRKK